MQFQGRAMKYSEEKGKSLPANAEAIWLFFSFDKRVPLTPLSKQKAAFDLGPRAEASSSYQHDRGVQRAKATHMRTEKPKAKPKSQERSNKSRKPRNPSAISEYPAAQWRLFSYSEAYIADRRSQRLYFSSSSRSTSKKRFTRPMPRKNT